MVGRCRVVVVVVVDWPKVPLPFPSVAFPFGVEEKGV